MKIFTNYPEPFLIYADRPTTMLTWLWLQCDMIMNAIYHRITIIKQTIFDRVREVNWMRRAIPQTTNLANNSIRLTATTFKHRQAHLQIRQPHYHLHRWITVWITALFWCMQPKKKVFHLFLWRLSIYSQFFGCIWTGTNVIRMTTSSNGNIFRVTGPLCGEFTGPGEIPAQRPVTRSFDIYFDLRLNKRLSKQPWGWWFETPSWSLWRHRNGYHFSLR